jgi:hypothetical protein
VIIPKGTLMEFVADGHLQKFEVEEDTTLDWFEDEVYNWFKDYRQESLCINGVSYTHSTITSGYLICEGKLGEVLLDKKVETWYHLKNVKNLLKLGVRRGDIIHLKGLSSVRVTEVDYGYKSLTLSVE